MIQSSILVFFFVYLFGAMLYPANGAMLNFLLNFSSNAFWAFLKLKPYNSLLETILRQDLVVLP